MDHFDLNFKKIVHLINRFFYYINLIDFLKFSNSKYAI